MTLETKAGEPLDRDRLTRDVRRLWATGLFSDIRVESVGGEIVFRVIESAPLVLSEVRFEPGSERRDVRIEKGTPIRDADAQRVTATLRTHFERDGYENPRVSAALTRVGGGRADLRLSIDPGERTRVGQVRFLGSTGVSGDDLDDALRLVRPRTVIPGLWKRRPAFSTAALESGLARIRSLLISRGHFDAKVRVDSVTKGDNKAAIGIRVDAGNKYRVRRVEMVDLNKAAQFSPQSGDLCGCLFDLRRSAQKEGRLDFGVDIEAADSSGEAKAVDLSVRVRTGPPYTVGRIQFHGNGSVRDTAVRAAFVLSEAAPFDWDRLERSLRRVNRLGLFEPLKSEDVRVVRNRSAGAADVHVSLKRKPLGHWFLSGPVGPFSVGGPLQAAVGSRLPGWGRGILEGSTYFLTFSVTAFSSPLLKALRFVPDTAVLPMIVLERPWLPGQDWTSGFAISPRLGWRGMLGMYGATQARHRMRILLVGDRPAEPEIVATVERLGTGSEPVEAGPLICEPRRSRWSRAAGIAATALDIALQTYR